LLQHRCTPLPGERLQLSHAGLDSVPVSVLFSFMGGVSFPGVLSAGGSLVANRRLHRLFFIYTPTDVTSGKDPESLYVPGRTLKWLKVKQKDYRKEARGFYRG